MNLDYESLQEAGKNAVFWTGVAALAISVTERSFDLAIFAAAVFLFEIVLSAVLPSRKESRQQEASGMVVFRLTPLQYPKILDADINDFAPEFIRLDIFKGSARVFSGDLARETYKSLRDTIGAALSKQPFAQPATQPTPQPAQQSQKKQRKK